MIAYLKQRGRTFFVGTAATRNELRSLALGRLLDLDRLDLMSLIRVGRRDRYPQTWRDVELLTGTEG